MHVSWDILLVWAGFTYSSSFLLTFIVSYLSAGSGLNVLSWIRWESWFLQVHTLILQRDSMKFVQIKVVVKILDAKQNRKPPDI